jgi:hypothetical protein
MKQLTFNPKFTFIFGAILMIPTAYFIFISLLKYGLGVSFLFDNIQPLLEKMGIKEAIGWNINLLILFGPVIGLLLNLAAILKVGFHNEKNTLLLEVSIMKYKWNIIAIVIAGMLLMTLFFYLLGENCRC